ncbi:MAG: family 16 glycoside hydrolase [Planctomycetaceae bacterium]
MHRPRRVCGRRRRIVALAVVAAAVAARPLALHGADPVPAAPAASVLAEARRICVLGDSITFDGGWVAALAAWLEARGSTAAVVNCGLPSETCSGLSEEGHAGGQFPRPDVHERLDRVLRVVRPDVVIACYGMNCGIYQPADPSRFAAFRAGMEKLHAAVEQAGARIIHLTPPVYDGRPGTRHPAGDVDYDAVLATYSEWLLARRADGWMVIDVHGPMRRWLDERRGAEPAFTFQPDAVHPDEAGQWTICRAVLLGLGDERTAAEPEPVSLRPFLPDCAARMRILREAYVAAAGHRRPGIAVGLPVADAEATAARITDSLRRRRPFLVGEKRPSGEWKGAVEWPRPPVVDPGPAAAAPAPIPADAVVLFDGICLSAFAGSPAWHVADAVATVAGGSITTKDAFGDCHVHVEFRTPRPAGGTGQGRGNSGIYLMGKYEIQILDSFEDGTDGPRTYPDGQCGALYKQRPPAVNASRAPGEWQSFDILFTRPRFSADGGLEAPGRVSVIHNGVAIHADTVILGTTGWADPPAYQPHPDALPLSIQDHGNPVQFRSLWVRRFEPAVGTMAGDAPPGNAVTRHPGDG